MSISQKRKNRSGSVLVVTDTPEDVAILEDQLGKAGYELNHTWGAEQALQLIDESKPDLILLDATSPTGDCNRICRSLRARPETEAIPVIVIAEGTSVEQQQMVYEIGADGLICRPFQPAELLTRVRNLVRMKALHDRVADQNRQLLQANIRLDQLNQEMLTRNRELEQGMAMAHRLQEALMPQQYPRVNNVAFAHKYAPAEAIGGDFFQIFGLDEDRAGIFIADVSGHGVRAAIITSIVKTVIDYIDISNKTPSDVLKDFNSRFRSVLGPLTPQIYATGVFMMVNGRDRELQVSCAGHPSPLHIDKTQMKTMPLVDLDDCGPAIGFIGDPEYPTVARRLDAGDIVFGFTDGIYEVLNEEQEMFGLSRLEQLIAANTRLIPRDLIQKVITETDEFMGSEQRPDDICVVTVEMC
jgi:sigma-B regulation protein RsbU (phosphoserine phosphatase)